MPDKILVVLGATIFVVILALLATYRDYKPMVEAALNILGGIGAILGIYEFLRRPR